MLPMPSPGGRFPPAGGAEGGGAVAQTSQGQTVRVPDAPNGRGGLDRYFEITARGSTVRTEILAGVTTFLTMAYILFVNPSILGLGGAGLGFAQVLTVPAQAPATARKGFAFGSDKLAQVLQILDLACDLPRLGFD